MDTFVYRLSWGSARARGTRGIRRGFVVAASCALIAIPTISQAATPGEITKRGGLGVGSALCSMVYAPAKMVYAFGGMVIGGLAWAFSGGDNEVAKVVLTPSILGDYVVTPTQLVGEEPLEFFGRDPDYAGQLDVAAAPPAPEGRSLADASVPEEELDRRW